jgi:hypothetical protein
MITRDAYAEFTRHGLPGREWDTPAAFMTLNDAGGRIAIGTYAMIDPAIHPEEYPAWMIALAAEQRAAHPGQTSAGYALQFEGYEVDQPDPAADPELYAAWQHARMTRTYDRLPGHREIATCWTAAPDGRLWSATVTRGRPGVAEQFYPAIPDPDAESTPGGAMVIALVSIAEAAGLVDQGAPLPDGLRRP